MNRLSGAIKSHLKGIQKPVKQSLKPIPVEVYNNIICISYFELVKSNDNTIGVMSAAQYRKEHGKLTIPVRGGNGRKALIEYDSLPLKYRQAWEALHGDPRDMKKQPELVNMITVDHAARATFEKYQYGNKINLKDDVQEKYARTAEIFNALTTVIKNMTAERQKARGSMRGAWTEYLIPAIEKARIAYQPNDLPEHPRKLKEKYELYVQDGCTSLIHKNYGNVNRSNLDQLAISVIVKFAAEGQQYAGTTACEAYNVWAVENNRPAITTRTFNNCAKKYKDIITETREGANKARDMFEEIIKRARPSAPLLLVNSDDNNLDFFFRAKKEKLVNGEIKETFTNYYRYKMYLVLDPFCDYILGYAIGDEITTELVVEAYRNAANHVKELTGSYHLWNQIVADRWNYANMKIFFEKQAKTTFTQVHNAKSKYIERFFGIEWHEEMKRFGNHSGYNITAKKKPNADWIKANIKNFPTKEEGVYQISKFVERLRNKLYQDTGKTRKQLWIESFFANEKARVHAITDQRFLNIFGVQRYKKGGQEPQVNRITNKGIDITINHDKINYQVPDELYRATLGKDAYTIIDPTDLTRVLIKTADEQQAFVAQQRRIMPSCIADMVAGDAEYWQSQLYLREKRKEDTRKEREEHLERASDIEIETYLQIGDLTKAPHQAIEDIYLSQIVGKSESIHNIITH